MIAIDDMFRQPMAQAVGWALVQFLWQGTLIGVLAALLLGLLRRSAADVRYVISAVALALMVTMPVVTAIQTYVSAGTMPVSSSRLPASAGSSAPATAEATQNSSQRLQTLPSSSDFRTRPSSDASAIDEWLPLMVTVWLAGVAILTLRLLSGWIWVQRMKFSESRPVHHGLEEIAVRLMRRLHIGRAVRFLESARVDVPTVIGWLKPVVLLPASALAGLTPRQIEAILAHELAHIRRHDYLVNLLQAVVETLLFYHPAVWWLSRRIRIEREHCCDDLAVSLCGDPVTYAAALAELEGLRSSDGQLALAATGGSLLQRVKRVLGAPSHAGRAPGWLAAAVAMLVMAALSASSVHTGALTGMPEAAIDQAAASTPAVPAAPASAAPVTPEQPVSAAPAVVVATTRAHAAVAGPQIVAAPTAAAGASPASTASTPAAAVTAGQRTGESSGNYVWSDNGEKVEVNFRGEFEFSADDTDVARMSPGGYLRLRHGKGWILSGHTVEFSADSSGAISRRFWVGSTEHPFEPDGRTWLATMLPRFIRQSGIGAPARVARIHKTGGVTGVLAEVSRIEGSWAKHIYLTELTKLGLGAADLQRVFSQAGAEIDSDFELASFLVSSNKLIAEDGARRAYLEAARSIGSDFELARVLKSLIKGGPVAAPIATGLLETSTSIDSDFEEATLLVEFARQQTIDAAARAPFFKALGTVGSSFEHGRVLQTVLQRTDLATEARAAALESAAAIDSDFEAATVLVQFVKNNPVEGNSRAPFFRAAGSIGSDFEHGRVLQALAKRSDLSDATVVDLLKSAQGVASHFERAQVLVAVASNHVLTREGRDAYIDAAEKLGDFEQGRVLSALVKNERRTAR